MKNRNYILLSIVKYVSCSVMSDSAIPWTVACQAPLSMKFSRQEYWSGLPCPLPGNLPNPGIEPPSLISPALAGGFFTTCATSKYTDGDVLIIYLELLIF